MTKTHQTEGRRRHLDTPTRLEITLPRSVIDRLEIHLHDPLTGKMKYGARSKLFQLLLREHFLKIQRNGTLSLDETLRNNLTKAQEIPTIALIDAIESCLLSGGFPLSTPLLIHLLKERLV